MMLATCIRALPMLRLHYFPGNASLIPHLVLEELGARFELACVDRANAAHKSEAYLRLNPNGLIPVLVDDREGSRDSIDPGPLVLYETAAICLHLCDTHPGSASLLPAHGGAARARACQWLFWLADTLQAALIVYFYPERWADDDGATAQVKARAEARVGELLDILDAEFARHGGPWFAGAAFSVLDPYAFVLCRWTRGFARPARTLLHVKPWLDRVLARPATQRALATEGLEAPFV